MTFEAWYAYLEPFEKWFPFAGVVFLGWLLSVVVDWGLLGFLQRVARKTKWAFDDVIVMSLKGATFWIIFISSIKIAITTLPTQKTEFLILSQKVLLVLALILSVWVIADITGKLLENLIKKVAYLPSTSIFINIARFLVILTGVLVILNTLGISIIPILTALGVGGLAVSLALQDTLSNIFAGIQIIAARQIKPGDFIELDSGEKGFAEDITWRNTTIRRMDDNMVIVPNAKLAGVIVTNYNQPANDLTVYIRMGVSYSSDLEHVEKVTLAAAREVVDEFDTCIAGFEPQFIYQEFSDSSINFRLAVRVRNPMDRLTITHEMIKRIHARYEQENIVIPFPQRTLHLKQPISV